MKTQYAIKTSWLIKQWKFQWLRVAGFALGHVLDLGTKAAGSYQCFFLRHLCLLLISRLLGSQPWRHSHHRIRTAGWVFSQPFKDMALLSKYCLILLAVSRGINKGRQKCGAKLLRSRVWPTRVCLRHPPGTCPHHPWPKGNCSWSYHCPLCFSLWQK